MEENNNKKCDCLICRHGKCAWFRWVLGLIILWAVFALGVKVGELKYTIKDGLRNGGYYGMMGGYGDDSYGYKKGGFFPGMMGQNMMYYFSKLQSATSTR